MARGFAGGRGGVLDGHSIFDQAPVAILAVGTNELIAEVNMAACALMGWQGRGAVGKDFFSLVSEPGREAARRAFHCALESGGREEARVRLLTYGGTHKQEGTAPGGCASHLGRVWSTKQNLEKNNALLMDQTEHLQLQLGFQAAMSGMNGGTRSLGAWANSNGPMDCTRSGPLYYSDLLSAGGSLGTLGSSLQHGNGLSAGPFGAAGFSQACPPTRASKAKSHSPTCPSVESSRARGG
ncbi:unnamed protein product [Prorocentrum cordatum]|uniref:PAS domain-containing protein n=1 Tax=Prorocentrum cordatum TaxID=2364126 RepID=A0ABN9X588_9DINO|nr:unnamed protein product [Polarella glacialis]